VFVLLAPTLDDAAKRWLLLDVETIWLDRGYDSEVTRQRLAEREIGAAIIAKKRKRGSKEPKTNQPMAFAGPSRGRTRGSRTSVDCGATTTERPSTG
jgi:beta-glucosidase-like glycosyl hydrolase